MHSLVFQGCAVVGWVTLAIVVAIIKYWHVPVVCDKQKVNLHQDLAVSEITMALP